MGNLTANFSTWEFKCHGQNCCSHTSPVDMALVFGLQHLADLCTDKLGHKCRMPLSCGFRCLTHNRSLGSHDNSYHPKGKAADAQTPEGLTLEEFFELARQVSVFRDGGIGLYDWGLHLAVQESMTRFDKRTGEKTFTIGE